MDAFERGEDPVAAQGHEPDRGIQAEGLGTAGRRSPALHPAEVEVGEPEPLGLGAPDLRRPPRVGELPGPVDQHEGPAVDLDVAVVGECGGQPPDMGQVVRVAELLAHEDLARLGVPVPGPLLVGPAEGDGEVRRSRGQDLVDRPLEEALPVEPVVVVDEPGDAVGGGQRGLGLADLGDAQVVIPELTGDMGLVVAGEERPRFGDVGPLGEAGAPPFVVLGNGMELGEIEGEGARLVPPGSPDPPFGAIRQSYDRIHRCFSRISRWRRRL